MQHKKIILCAFVISGLQVQLLSPAPRKILRYTVKTAARIVGFLLLYALQIYQNVPYFCLTAQKCLAVCLTARLVPDARRRGRGGSGCEICGQSGCGCCACLMVSAGGFPITRTSAAYTGLAVRYWVWIPLRSNGDRMKCFNYVLTKYV